MRGILLKDLCKSIGGAPVIDALHLQIPAGTFFALLGPSGCGKTTLLRLIAGLEEVDRGQVFLGSEEITYCPLAQRPIHIVFQNYALFPHLSVFENIAYRLRIQQRSLAVVRQRVGDLLTTFQLQQHQHKLPAQLSGGQQQRVALARAIIGEPEVLLLDEPLVALDFNLREALLLELIALQARLQTTFLYVTHDQLEALSAADNLAIMNSAGKIEQVGSPEQIYEAPRSAFVARSVGATNLLQGTLRDVDSAPLLQIPQLGTFAITIGDKKPWMQDGQPLLVSIRPEKIHIATRRLHFPNVVCGSVDSIIYQGWSTQYRVRLAGGEMLQALVASEARSTAPRIDCGDRVYLHWQKESGVILEQ